MSLKNSKTYRTLLSRERVLFFSPRNGLSLVELLIVIFIFSSTVGGIGMAVSAAKEAFALIEFKKAHIWIQGIFIEAALTDRPFMFKYTTRSASTDTLRIQWLDTLDEKVFDTGRSCYFRGMSASESFSVYSPKWHTLTPGLTLKVTIGPGSSSKKLGYIVISPYCYITIKKDPPKN